MARRASSRSNVRVLAWMLGALCLALPAPGAERAADPRTVLVPAAGAERTPDHRKVSMPTPEVGCDSIAVRKRLASVDGADIARACGNISRPWAYRGPSGRHMALWSYGGRSGDKAWARAFAAQLLATAPVDSAIKMPSIQFACDSMAPRPVYLVTLHSGKRQTLVLLRFDIDEAVLFDADEPLGMLHMGAHADSLWTALAARLDDDPLLRGPRPAPELESNVGASGADTIYVEELPDVIGRVPPRYPEAARQQGIDGIVWVQLLVGKDGAVRDAIVISGPAALRDEALEATWQWKFKPARSKGEPVAVWVAAPVKFTLH